MDDGEPKQVRYCYCLDRNNLCCSFYIRTQNAAFPYDYNSRSLLKLQSLYRLAHRRSRCRYSKLAHQQTERLISQGNAMPVSVLTTDAATAISRKTMCPSQTPITPHSSGPIYSASVGARGGVSLTCTPPLFACPESLNGSFHPPSFSGVASHSLIKCLFGLPVISA